MRTNSPKSCCDSSSVMPMPVSATVMCDAVAVFFAHRYVHPAAVAVVFHGVGNRGC